MQLEQFYLIPDAIYGSQGLPNKHGIASQLGLNML